jgi:DNA-binding response OmpR family regulator
MTTAFKDFKGQEGKQAGTNGWIVKPFTAEQLVTAIRMFAMERP